MNILIKGMKKSESCECCDFLTDDGYCIAMGGDELKEEAYDEIGYLKSDYIDPDCPVVGINTVNNAEEAKAYRIKERRENEQIH